MAFQKFDSRSVQVSSPQGRFIRDFVLGEEEMVHTAIPHPNGSDYVLLAFEVGSADEALSVGFDGDDDSKTNDLRLTLKIMPDDDNTRESLKIDRSAGELIHGAAAAFSSGLLFVYFRRSPSRGEYELTAFRPTDRGFEQLYSVEAPRVELAMDECSREAAAIYTLEGETRAIFLDENKPEFERGSLVSGRHSGFPSFSGVFIPCGAPTGAMKARSEEFMDVSERMEFAERQRLRRMNDEAPTPADAEEFLAYMHSIRQDMGSELIGLVKEEFNKDHPDHYMTRLEKASDAVEDREWSEIVSLLSGTPRPDMDPGIARHVCHLLGMGLFGTGQVKEALDVWREGDRYDGDCELSPFIEYARLAAMPAKKRRSLRNRRGMGGALAALEEVDDHLSAGRWTEVVSILENRRVFADRDSQTLARLAEAHLQLETPRSDPGWHRKAAALAIYADFHRKDILFTDQVLPPYIQTWSASRLQKIADRCKYWLGHITGEHGPGTK